MRRFWVVLALPFLLANACEVRPDPPRTDWLANEVDRARLERLLADPWVRPEQSDPGGSAANFHPGGGRPLLLRPSTIRWSDELIPGSLGETDAPYNVLFAEIGAARQAGWFVTGAYCFGGNRLVVGFAKPADDLDHAEAAYLYEEPREKYDSSGERVQTRRIVVVGIAPHHADRGWPKYVPVELADTCLADVALMKRGGDAPKGNPPPPEIRSYQGPLDEAGKHFMSWDDSNRFVDEIFQKPASTTPATPST